MSTSIAEHQVISRAPRREPLADERVSRLVSLTERLVQRAEGRNGNGNGNGNDNGNGNGAPRTNGAGSAEDDRTLKIRHERASQRMHQRISAPLNVSINDREYLAGDWSLGGLRVTGYDRPVESGDHLTLKLSIPFQGFDVSFDADTEVVRGDPDTGDLALKFVELDKRARVDDPFPR